MAREKTAARADRTGTRGKNNERAGRTSVEMASASDGFRRTLVPPSLVSPPRHSPPTSGCVAFRLRRCAVCSVDPLWPTQRPVQVGPRIDSCTEKGERKLPSGGRLSRRAERSHRKTSEERNGGRRATSELAEETEDNSDSGACMDETDTVRAA